MIRFDQPRLRSGGGGEVRVAINASILQRFFGTGYYYIDDVPIPYKALLGEERLLLPSQQESLLQPLLTSTRGAEDSTEKIDGKCPVATTEGNESSFFGPLWIRFAARLAEALAESEDASITHYLGVLVWFLVVAALVFLIVSEYFESVPELIVIISMLFGVNLNMLSAPAGGSAIWIAQAQQERDQEGNGDPTRDQRVQQIVDEMALLFSKQGYHVDCVHDNRRQGWICCPPLIYVRFTRSTTTNSTDNDGEVPMCSDVEDPQAQNDIQQPLVEIMEAWQRKTRAEHQDVMIAKRQTEMANRNRTSKHKQASGYVVCGIQVKKLYAYKPVIWLMMVPLTFGLCFTGLWMLFCFTGMGALAS